MKNQIKLSHQYKNRVDVSGILLLKKNVFVLEKATKKPLETLVVNTTRRRRFYINCISIIVEEEVESTVLAHANLLYLFHVIIVALHDHQSVAKR